MRFLMLNGRDIAYEYEAQMVTMPGLDGEFSVLDFHEPFLYRLRAGLVKVIQANAPRIQETGDLATEYVSIKDGIARFTENTLLILCELG